MQDSLNSAPDDEIDLRELFSALFAYKLIIAFTCCLGIVWAGTYSLRLKKVFISTASFRLEETNDRRLSLGGQGGLIANIANYSSLQSDVTLPIDLVGGRIFIEKLDLKLGFKTDPFFNPYTSDSFNLKSGDPFWKASIKRLIGWQNLHVDPDEVIWRSIKSAYDKNVIWSKTKGGAIQVSVTHESSLRAAQIANQIMDTIIFDSRLVEEDAQDNQLEYLSRTLAKALTSLETSQSNLQTFALKNSALPLEDFALGSIQLDALREQLGRTSELHAAVSELASLMQQKTIAYDNYLSLRQKFPIVDQVEFRRILGQNEIISSWSWPNESSVTAVFDTLSERKNRLQSQIDAAQIDAERYSRVLDVYAKLKREEKIAEATYTVLIEQVKSQSMVAGYRPDKSKIYEYAAPAIAATAPKRSTIMIFGAVLGVLLGCALALILARYRNTYYSIKSIIAGTQARFHSSIRTLIPLRKLSLVDINALLMKKSYRVLRDLAVEINKNGATQVVVTSSGAKLTGSELARVLGSYMQSATMTVAVIDFSQKEEMPDIDAQAISGGWYAISESEGQVSVLMPNGDLGALEILSERDFVKDLQSLSQSFGLIFLCADNDDVISLLRAVGGQKSFHITMARTKHTKLNTMPKICSFLPIQGLLHD